MWCCVLLFGSDQRWERGPEMFFVPFTQTSACFPYVFHVATGLITSVPVNDLPFLDDVVFVLWCYQEFPLCVGTFEVSLDSCFAAYVFETLTEAFGIWDHYKDVVVSVVVPMWVCVIVPLFLSKLEFQFGLRSVEHPIRITASAESCLDMLVFCLIIVAFNRHTGPCVWECCKCCICLWCCADCPNVDTDLYVLVSC